MAIYRPISLLVALSLMLASVPRAQCGAPAKHDTKVTAKTGCCAKHEPVNEQKDESKRPCAGCTNACCATAVLAIAPAFGLAAPDNGTPHHLTDDTAYHGSITHSIFHPPKAA